MNKEKIRKNMEKFGLIVGLIGLEIIIPISLMIIFFGRGYILEGTVVAFLWALGLIAINESMKKGEKNGR